MQNDIVKQPPASTEQQSAAPAPQPTPAPQQAQVVQQAPAAPVNPPVQEAPSDQPANPAAELPVQKNDKTPAAAQHSATKESTSNPVGVIVLAIIIFIAMTAAWVYLGLSRFN